ncbi:MAG: galactose mutarotase [Lentisphaeraceae bacterium]|nr:galactose mutarotase [Lentisphaeraceae bacterium]
MAKITTINHQTSVGEVQEYVIEGKTIKLSLLSLGASIYRLFTPDMDGKQADIVLGHKSIEDYVLNKGFQGSTIGRFTNRIENAAFTLNGTEYLLDKNNGENCLHGGATGFHTKNWQSEVLENGVKFTINSLDGENGFPGHLETTVTYQLFDDELHILYTAETDAETVVNLTNHSYFNLGGHESGTIFEHEFQIFADSYLPTCKNGIPRQETSVSKTPFDFKVFTPIVAALRSEDEQIQQVAGVDHCYILSSTEDMKEACVARHPWSGRTMTVMTTEPGLQLYTGNNIDDMTGKDDAFYGRYPAFCVETQHFPNSPNRPDFPSTTLRPGETFNSKTIYKFTVEDDA